MSDSDLSRKDYLSSRFGVTVSEQNGGNSEKNDGLDLSRRRPVHIELHQRSLSGFGLNFYVDESDFDPADFEKVGDREALEFGIVCEGLCFREGLLDSFDAEGFSLKLFKSRRSELPAKWTPNASGLTAFPNCFKNCTTKGPVYSALYFLTVFPCLTDVLTSIGAICNYLCCCGTVVQVQRKVRYPVGKTEGEYLAGPWKKVSETDSCLNTNHPACIRLNELLHLNNTKTQNSALLAPEPSEMER